MSAALPDLLAVMRDARNALAEAELLLSKVYEIGTAVIDNGEGDWVDVEKAAGRMNAAVDEIDAAIAKATGSAA